MLSGFERMTLIVSVRATLVATGRHLAQLKTFVRGRSDEDRMSTREAADCRLCQSVALPLKRGAVVRWERHDTRDFHYMTTAPANRRRQWAGPERVANLQGQIDAITAKGQVAWVDVKDNGDFVLYQAAHGAVPVNLPRTPR